MKTSGPSLTQVLSVPCPSIFCQGLQILLLITHPVIVKGSHSPGGADELCKHLPNTHPEQLRALLLFNCLIVSDSFVILWTPAYPATLSMGFSRQEYWSGSPFPSSRGSFQPRVWKLVCISCIGSQILYHWASWAASKWVIFIEDMNYVMVHGELCLTHFYIHESVFLAINGGRQLAILSIL